MKDDIKLAQLMERARKSGTTFPIELCLHIIDEVCKSIELVHGERKVQGERRPAVHCNLTPENIIITPEGLVKVTGFGAGEDLARRNDASPETVEKQVMYLSPEQAAGSRVDERVEVYAAAAVLYELLTETPVFSPERKQILMLGKIQNGDIQKPSRVNPRVTGYLEQVLLRALERDRSRRYQSASEFSFAIERILSRFSTANLRDNLVAVLKAVSTLPEVAVKRVESGASPGPRVEIMGAFEPVDRRARKFENGPLRLESADERDFLPFRSVRTPRQSHTGGRVPLRRLILLTLLLGALLTPYLESLDTDIMLKSVGLSSVATIVRTSVGHISRFCRKKILASIP